MALGQGRQGAGLEHAFVAEAKEAVITDHDVVEHAHTHDIADLFETLSDIDIFRAWG